MNPLTASRPDDLVTPLWRYALTLYGRPDVATSCLLLQKSLGVDVCLLIYALYANHQDRRLSASALAKADHQLKAWRDQVVLPLRRVRETMKAGVSEIPLEHSDWVREQIKATELNAEQVVLACLNTQIASLPQAPASTLSRIAIIKKIVHGVLTHSAQGSECLSLALARPEVRLAADILASQAHRMRRLGQDTQANDPPP